MYKFRHYSFMQIAHYITPENVKDKIIKKSNKALADKQFNLL